MTHAVRHVRSIGSPLHCASVLMHGHIHTRAFTRVEMRAATHTGMQASAHTYVRTHAYLRLIVRNTYAHAQDLQLEHGFFATRNTNSHCIRQTLPCIDVEIILGLCFAFAKNSCFIEELQLPLVSIKIILVWYGLLAPGISKFEISPAKTHVEHCICQAREPSRFCTGPHYHCHVSHNTGLM